MAFSILLNVNTFGSKSRCLSFQPYWWSFWIFQLWHPSQNFSGAKILGNMLGPVSLLEYRFWWMMQALRYTRTHSNLIEALKHVLNLLHLWNWVDYDLSSQKLQYFQVLIMTYETLFKLVCTHSVVSAKDIHLLILDECHLAIEPKHFLSRVKSWIWFLWNYWKSVINPSWKSGFFSGINFLSQPIKSKRLIMY